MPGTHNCLKPDSKSTLQSLLKSLNFYYHRDSQFGLGISVRSGFATSAIAVSGRMTSSPGFCFWPAVEQRNAMPTILADRKLDRCLARSSAECRRSRVWSGHRRH
jgi:hypothetical protein